MHKAVGLVVGLMVMSMMQRVVAAGQESDIRFHKFAEDNGRKVPINKANGALHGKIADLVGQKVILEKQIEDIEKHIQDLDEAIRGRRSSHTFNLISQEECVLCDDDYGDNDKICSWDGCKQEYLHVAHRACLVRALGEDPIADKRSRITFVPGKVCSVCERGSCAALRAAYHWQKNNLKKENSNKPVVAPKVIAEKQPVVANNECWKTQGRPYKQKRRRKNVTPLAAEGAGS